ncbi:cbb3-type cytochrome c oxidase N-terminal domain-containing protein [Haoranjiania flava]|uniref:C-type cytochrome n=1 Tax=Haoranjiania flava TaxID=1856322 RepID=A0AAE3IN05_9BACT|nr:cbb3-type cytochrome c oxidase N-terminal domain-containing protein [Haoranjiania flava]MCU7694055.1 c-type cytochrome [Haoranjiania flava]
MKLKFRISIFILMMITSLFAVAQTEATPAAPVADTNSLLAFDTNTVMAICVAALLFVIILLAFMLKSSIDLYRDKYKQERTSGGNAKAANILVVFLLAGFSAFAQTAEPAAADAVATAPLTAGQFNSSMITMILGVAILIELFIIFYLIKWIKFFTGVQAFEDRRRIELGADESVVTRGGFKAWWYRINKFRSNKDEKDLDIGHSYDGIRELDNDTPPWFTWSFIATIIISLAYIWYYNSPRALSQDEEYQQEVAIANKKLETYMASQANSVDETTVQMLDAAGIQSGNDIFKTKCVACHGQQGEGGIGPNLTDNFALHGGTIHDVFKTIKYGVVDKGMQAWNAELSPMQIAQVSSYVMSLQGTNPPNGKAPQGTEFNPSAAPAAGGDSTATPAGAASDTAKVAAL